VVEAKKSLVILVLCIRALYKSIDGILIFICYNVDYVINLWKDFKGALKMTN